jgi:hypothetical protein
MFIEYDPASIVPHFSDHEMQAMKAILSLDLPGFAFDPDYVQHLAQFNGGAPKVKYFLTQTGRCMPIDRFLNYSATDQLSSPYLRSLNANVAWANLEDRLDQYLLPFAVLPNGDYLCFDYRNGMPPCVVLWIQERSDEDCPYTEAVARSFSAFIHALSPKFIDA